MFWWECRNRHSAGEKYAIDNGFEYVLLDVDGIEGELTLVDPLMGIIKVDDKAYEVEDSFDFNSLMGWCVEATNKRVKVLFVNNRVHSIEKLEEEVPDIKGTTAETYADKYGFKFIDLDGTATTNKYPVITSEVKGRQFRLKWAIVPNAEKYGLAAYQSGKWRVKQQFAGNVTRYTSPKIKNGTYKMVVCAKIKGEWDTSSLKSRAFTVTIA